MTPITTLQRTAGRQPRQRRQLAPKSNRASYSHNYLRTRESGGVGVMIHALLYRTKSSFLSDLVRCRHISGLSRQGIDALGRWHLLLVQLLKRLHDMKRAWKCLHAPIVSGKKKVLFSNTRKAGEGHVPFGGEAKGQCPPSECRKQSDQSSLGLPFHRLPHFFTPYCESERATTIQ